MEQFISEDAKIAVKRGIFWLDENHPGWAERIDLDQLEMAECETCVIGQAVGDYTETIRNQAFNTRESVLWAVEHGFEWPGVAVYNEAANPTYDYSDLDTLWTEEVKKRLG